MRLVIGDRKEAPERDPTPGRVARNTAVPILAEVLAKLAPLFLFALIARTLGTEALGDYVLAFATTTLIFPVATFGMDRFLVREVARDRSALDRLFFDIVGLKVLVSVVGVLGATSAMALLGYSVRVQALTVLLGFATVFNVMGASSYGVFQAFERMEFQAYASVPHKYLTAILGIAVLFLGGGIVEVALAVLVAASIALLISLGLQFRFFRRPPMRFRPRRWPRLLRSAMPFGLQELFAQLHFRADIVLLSLLTSSAVVGWYGASYRLVEATMFIAWTLASAMMPMYSYLSETSTPSLRVSFEKSVKFMLVLLVPISVILFAGADGLIRVIYGQEQFAPSIGTLQLLAFAIVFYGVSHLSGSFLLSRGAGREFVWATATAALLNIALSLILIPRFSLEGAAAATLLSEFLLALAGLTLAQRTLGRLRWVGIASGAFVAGTVMAAVMLLVPRPVWLSLGIGPIVYVGLLAAFEVRTFREDADVVRGVVRRGLVRPPR